MRTLVNEMRTMEEVMNQLFGDSRRPTHPHVTTIPIDVLERENRLWVRALVPSVDPSEVEVTVEKGVLTIQAQSTQEPQVEGEKVFRREISSGKFARSLRVPEGYDLEQVQAQSKNGILTISIPKLIEEKPKSLRIPVTIDEPAIQ